MPKVRHDENLKFRTLVADLSKDARYSAEYVAERANELQFMSREVTAADVEQVWTIGGGRRKFVKSERANLKARVENSGSK